MSRIYALLIASVLVIGTSPARAQLDPALTEAPPHLFAQRDAAPELATRLSASSPDGEFALRWAWTGEPRWMGGRAIAGGETFFKSVIRGRHFRGSTIGPEGDVPIDIVLSTTETSLAQVFRTDLGWAPSGVGTFPGAVYDVSDPDNPRRLNVVISEHGGVAPPNMTWDPSADEGGNLEFLWVMASDYDGTGTTYENVNIANDADDLDILYVWAGRLEPGRTFFESDPATLSIELLRIDALTATSGDEEVVLSWDYNAPDEAASIVLYWGTTSPAEEVLATLSPDASSYTVSIPDPDERVYFRAEALNSDGEVVDISAELRAEPTSVNMYLAGRLDPAGTYGDIWGYVDSDTGREYALLTARAAGLYIIDVTDDVPVEVGFVAGGADAKDIKTYGDYAYLANENSPIQVIDLSDINNPVQVGTLDAGGSDGGSHNVLVDGDHLYVVGGRSPGGLRIYSLADPTAPAYVGGIAGLNGTTYYHDVEIIGDLLYGAAIYNQGVDIIDISDKSNPTWVSTFQYAASSYQGAHNICATEAGNYVFVGDEIGSEPHTRVFDVSDPNNVEQVADIIVNPNAPTHNCYVKNNLLYIAHYTEGVRVFDVTTPEVPVATAYYDTYAAADTGFRGNWTVYPYLPSGKILASDMQRGLFVLRLGDSTVDNEPITDGGSAQVSGFTLGAAYPNPAAGTITVPFLLSESAHVRLTLFDALGRKVAVLADETRGSGSQTIGFDGSHLPAGAYFYRLELDGSAATRQVQTRSLTIYR